jgi:hypothetical protein
MLYDRDLARTGTLIFLTVTTSRPVLGPTLPLYGLGTEALSRGAKTTKMSQ